MFISEMTTCVFSSTAFCRRRFPRRKRVNLVLEFHEFMLYLSLTPCTFWKKFFCSNQWPSMIKTRDSFVMMLCMTKFTNNIYVAQVSGALNWNSQKSAFQFPTFTLFSVRKLYSAWIWPHYILRPPAWVETCYFFDKFGLHALTFCIWFRQYF
jgi:hypothetical protein